MTTAYRFMVFFRAVFGGLLIWCLFAQRAELTIEFGIPFLLTLVLPYLGKRDSDYYRVDSMFSILFLVSLLFSFYQAWPDLFTWHSPDKAFHLLAGATIASLGMLLYKKRIPNTPAFLATVVLFSLAIGAGWEVFEYVISQLPSGLMVPSTGYEDSMMDLVADAIGALISGLVFLPKK